MFRKSISPPISGLKSSPDEKHEIDGRHSKFAPCFILLLKTS
jgi:hypothetical protein